ncbi:WxcM-like domain-containing protein [Nocardioides sp. YIM 152315]|uniref:WxcM-like domain-containing protein n=1 Tax=Nocardioides sp. YIM 152315 TaxID=3031760 RepID=UPI0023DB839A|nr:WxcM-like domain-containing protein [Nocardioides sp. YIM 152315]MDF1604302.1 WxcM-like domain-containing protein [Nocardioides sp. YIM 152315]
MSAFVHPQALCESEHVGDGTRVWAFAHVLPGAVLGADCNICDGVFIENDVVVGDRVTIKCGVQLWDGVRLEDDVFVGPNATFTNDMYPRSREYPDSFATTVVGTGASIGANATILPGVRIGRRAMVGAGAVVTKDVPPNAVVVGNPAHIAGYSGSAQTVERPGSASPSIAKETEALPGGARVVTLTRATDLRGSLVAVDHEADLPFVARRTFVVYDVPSRDVRGEHAHRECEQLLVCLRGSVQALVDDGKDRRELLLDRPDQGLHVPAMVWGTQYKYSSDAVLLVYASRPYEDGDYIRDYETFLAEAAAR